MIRAVVICLAMIQALNVTEASAARPSTPGLWIAADRIVGFVPFTVYVYGKVVGTGPGDLQLCRTEAAWVAESANARRIEEDSPRSGEPEEGPGPQCAPGRMKPTPDGYDYSHDLQFDRPGTYQIRLVMVGGDGGRLVSNVVRVRAF
jgi:hypothetical protein